MLSSNSVLSLALTLYPLCAYSSEEHPSNLILEAEHSPQANPKQIPLSWAKSFLVNQVLLDELNARDAAANHSSSIAEALTLPSSQSELRIKHDFAKHLSTLLDHPFKAYSYQNLTLGPTQAQNPAVNPQTLLTNAATELSLPPKSIEALTEALAAPRPHCKAFSKDQSLVVNAQKNSLNSKNIISLSQLSKLISPWPAPRIQCVALLMQTQYMTTNLPHYDPQHILTLSHYQLPNLTQDQVIANFLVVSFLHHRNYAEALRVLFQLTKIDPFYGEIYKTIQSHFSISQNGKGQVSLKGI